MKLRHLISATLLGSFIGSSVFATDFVNAPLTNGAKKASSYDVQLISQNGTTWTYSVSKLEGYDLSHWVLGLAESCTVVSSSPSHDGVQVDPSVVNLGGPSFYGIKWNSSGGTFSFTLDQAYAATDLDVMTKASTGYGVTSGLTGPDCSTPLTGDLEDSSASSDDSSDVDSSANSDDSSDVDSSASSDDSSDVDSSANSDDSSDVDSSTGSSDSNDTTACSIAGGDSETLAAGGGDNKFTVEFVGKTGNQWSYKVSETGRALSHWSLGIENCEGHVQSGTGSHTGSIETGSGGNSDQLLKDTGVDWMVKWDTDGGVGNGEIFTITLDDDYSATEIGVLVKTGGNPKSALGTITAPNCAIPAPTCDDETDSNTADETDSNTADENSSTPVTLTCSEGTSMLGSFDWNGANYVLNGENVGGIAITGGIEGTSTTGANWAASAGTVSAILIAGSETSVTETLSDAVSGSFSNSALGDDIASVLFCGTESEQSDLSVALPAQGSIVGRVWALACEIDCDEYLGAKEVALESADHVLEIIQPNGEVLFIPVSIMR